MKVLLRVNNIQWPQQSVIVFDSICLDSFDQRYYSLLPFKKQHIYNIKNETGCSALTNIFCDF